METQFITVQGIKTRIKQSGSGQPIIFIHGHPDSADMWDDLISLLPSDYQFIAPDLPGYGVSGSAKGFDWSIENRGKWLADILDELKIQEPIVLVGHDHGGPFAASFAVQFPDRVRKLVLQNTLFHRDYNWHPFGKIYRTPLLGEYFAFSQRLAIARPIAIWYMKRGAPNLTSDYIIELSKTWTSHMGAAMLAVYRASDPENFAGWDDRLHEFIANKATLVLWGELDTYIPVKFAERLEKHGARLIRYPDAGHWLAVTKTREYAEELSTFLKEEV
jgi:pimeloyl-ACP methyl ester carboxylesterase